MEKLCFNLVLEINREFINADQRIGMRWRQLQKQKLILTIHFYELPENYGFELGEWFNRKFRDCYWRSFRCWKQLGKKKGCDQFLTND